MTAHILRARALIAHDDQVLVMKRIKNGLEYYTLPGGKAELGETPENTCLREVLEETTLCIAVVSEIGRFHDVYQSIPNTHVVFACAYLSGSPTLSGEELERHSADNHYEPLWLEFSQIAALNFMPEWMGACVRQHLAKGKEA